MMKKEQKKTRHGWWSKEKHGNGEQKRRDRNNSLGLNQPLLYMRKIM